MFVGGRRGTNAYLLGSEKVWTCADLCGRRGKGGGVISAIAPRGAADRNNMLGMMLVTTRRPKGKDVLNVLVEEGLTIKKELLRRIVIERCSKVQWSWSLRRGEWSSRRRCRSPEKIQKCKSHAHGGPSIRSVNWLMESACGKEARALIDYLNSFTTFCRLRRFVGGGSTRW
jgi:hypothetical protein